MNFVGDVNCYIALQHEQELLGCPMHVWLSTGVATRFKDTQQYFKMVEMGWGELDFRSPVAEFLTASIRETQYRMRSDGAGLEKVTHVEFECFTDLLKRSDAAARSSAFKL